MSQLFVDNIKNKLGGAIEAPSGVVVTGVITATSFVGSAASLTGIDATALTDSGGNVKIQANTSGIVVTGVSTFSGNVSVGKTLTYEDVTNVDSVGVVTARAGIKLGVGQSISAVSGIVTYYGDGSQLSGVESGVANFVASGTIANGQTVVINTDGTVGIVTQTTSNTPSAGTPVVFQGTSYSNNISATFDSNSNKVVITYFHSSSSYAIVGTVSGTSISFGSAVEFESSGAYYGQIVFDSNSNKVVISYVTGASGNAGTSVVGTISGTSISFGSKAIFSSSQPAFKVASTFDSTNNKIVNCYSDNGNGTHGTAVVGTVSGTSISFGSAVVYNAASTSSASQNITFDPDTGKVIITYTNDGNAYGAAIVGTVSGTSISFGSEVYFASAYSSTTSCTYDTTNNKVVIAYKDNDNSNYGTAIVGTVSGTSISFGTEVVFNSGTTSAIKCVYDSGNDKVVIAYSDDSNSGKGTVIAGTVSGTSISFGGELVYNLTASSEMLTYDSSNEKIVIAYRDYGNSSYGTAVVVTSSSSSTNLTAENYIGIAAEAIANTATGKINILGGTNTGQTGLTTAKTYYVQNNGSLATSAGSPSVVAGTSISDTKILIRE